MNKVDKEYWKDRPVLVTGASGFLGSNVCEQLLVAGANIISLVRDQKDNDYWFPYQSTTVVNGDICNLELLKRVLMKYEIKNVFHLAAQPLVGIGVKDPYTTYETNVRGTWTLLEAIRQAEGLTPKLVFASTDKSYGRSEVLPYTEKMPLNGAVSGYEVSKAVAEKIVDCYSTEHELPIITTRCANMFGEYDLNWNRIVPGTIRSLARNFRPVIRTDGSMIRDYIYVKDAARATIMLAETHQYGKAFNISSEDHLSVKSIVERIIYFFGDTTIEPIIENKDSNEIPEQRLDSSLLRKTINWTHEYSINQALTNTIDWYKGFLT